MKGLTPAGAVLTSIGFIVAAYGAIRNAEVVHLPVFFGGVGTMLVGIVLLRLSRRLASGDQKQQAQNLEELVGALGTVVEELTVLESKSDDLDYSKLPARIDDAFIPPLEQFVERRETIVHRFGTQPYAELMSAFASGERYLHRAWSTSADGYDDEAKDCLSKSLRHFTNAQAILTRLVDDKSRPPQNDPKAGPKDLKAEPKAGATEKART